MNRTATSIDRRLRYLPGVKRITNECEDMGEFQAPFYHRVWRFKNGMKLSIIWDGYAHADDNTVECAVIYPSGRLLYLPDEGDSVKDYCTVDDAMKLAQLAVQIIPE